MKDFKTKIEGHTGEYDFLCFDNTHPIEIGDIYIFFFAGIADVQRCLNEHEKSEINPNNRVKDETIIDLVAGFWKKCYKIKSTNFDLSQIL